MPGTTAHAGKHHRHTFSAILFAEGNLNDLWLGMRKVVADDQLTLHPVRTIRKYPDMAGLPAEELAPRLGRARGKSEP
jgi:hypothetical protein